MPKIVDRNKYREELLLKSFDLFTSRGYANITMREIAGELKISTGTLYHYFQNKQTILQSMLETIAVKEINRVIDIVYQTDNIEQRVVLYLNYFKEREDFFEHLMLLLLDFKKFCVSREHQKFLNNFAEIIFNKVAEGVGTDNDFGALAFIFLTGVGYMRLVVPETIDIDRQFNMTKELIRHYLRQESTLFKSQTKGRYPKD